MLKFKVRHLGTNLSVVFLQLHVKRLIEFASFCYFLPTFLIFFKGQLWIVVAMFMGIQHESALTEMPFYLLLDLVRLELRSASELIQPVLINLGRPSFEFDSAHVKYGV